MWIQSLTLKNYRRFEDLHVEFNLDQGQGGLTVLVAQNGEGKTSILDAINVAWGTFIGVMPKATGASLRESDQREEFVDGRTESCGPLEIAATFLCDDSQEPIEVKRAFTESKKRPTTSTKDAKALTAYARQLLANPGANVNWPLIAYYGDNRLWAGERLTEQRVANTLAMGRAYGYSDATNPKSGYKEFSVWFPALEFVTFVEEQRRIVNDAGYDEERFARYQSQLSPIKEALRRALKPTGWDEVGSDFSHGIWAINTSLRSKTLIDSLSAGVKIIIGLVGDLAFRCVKLNPRLGRDALTLTPGVVLIDEIELHLHPAWQQDILPTLRSIFPKIQFIVTTHSPQIVSSAPRECVRILRDGGVQNPDFQTQGVESQEILREIFGVDPAPANDPFVIKLFEYDETVRAGKADEELGKKLYAELVEHFGLDYPPLERIELFRRQLKKSQTSDEGLNA